MGDDQTSRIIRALEIAAVLPFGIYHRLRSQATGEKLDRRQEGLFILLTLRPIILVGMIGFLTFVASPARMAWSSVVAARIAPLGQRGYRPADRFPARLDLPHPGHQHHQHGRDQTASHTSRLLKNSAKWDRQIDPRGGPHPSDSLAAKLR